MIDYIDWEQVSAEQVLSNSFISKYHDKLDWIEVSREAETK